MSVFKMPSLFLNAKSCLCQKHKSFMYLTGTSCKFFVLFWPINTHFIDLFNIIKFDRLTNNLWYSCVGTYSSSIHHLGWTLIDCSCYFHWLRNIVRTILFYEYFFKVKFILVPGKFENFICSLYKKSRLITFSPHIFLRQYL